MNTFHSVPQETEERTQPKINKKTMKETRKLVLKLKYIQSHSFEGGGRQRSPFCNEQQDQRKTDKLNINAK
jgi:hypothetical protein